MFGVEVNLAPRTEFDRYNTDPLETICQRNVKMLAEGKQPTYVLIGITQTMSEARQLIETHSAAR